MLKPAVLAMCTGILAACATAGEQTFTEAAEATYELEKSHAFLTWRISHNGLSKYTARFTDFDATIDFNPDNPVTSSVSATINPLSVETDHPTRADSWNAELATDDRFFNGDEFPEITFVSTGIEQTGEFTGIVTGDLTLRGVSLPVSLDVTYNGTGNAPWFGTRDLIGFSARGTFNRSDFGMTALLPNIGDEIEVIIEAEFLQTGS
ncbi:MAG: YceI family protein [Pseudomonadota bacterium]